MNISSLVPYLAMVVSATASSAALAQPWLDSSEYGSIYVVQRATPSEAEAKGATEFTKNWLLVTGKEMADPSVPGAIPVYLGLDAAPQSIREKLDVNGLGEDGVLIKTFGEGATRALVIAGGSGKGPLYGVYQFFEDYFGVRWLAPDAIHVPRPPASLCHIDFRYAPPFARRLTQMPYGADNDIYRVTTGPKFGLYGHNLYDLVRPDEYFATHPEYFSEIGGERIAPVGFYWHDLKAREGKGRQLGQLCMTNPDVQRLIAEELGRRIQKKPDAKVWSVNQMDWANNCQCKTCKALDDQEGTPMGSYLTGINAIADILAQRHPGYKVHTYAYAYTRTPPKRLKPRPNVIVELCTIECDFAQPIAEKGSNTNDAFMKDFAKWSKLTHNLYIYNYPWNYSRYQRMHPNFRVLAPNIHMFYAHHAMGVHEQGPGVRNMQHTVEFGTMRSYIISRLLWNPKLDGAAVRDEFIELYYQEAAPFIKEFIAAQEKALDASGSSMTCFDPGVWIDAALVAETRVILEKARAAAKTPEIRRRVDIACVPVELAALECRPDITMTESAITLTRPPSLTIDAYFDLIRGYGASMVAENVPIEEGVKAFQWGTLARVETSPLISIENDRWLLQTAPAFKGSILRMRDKKNDVDMLRGYLDYGIGAGTYQDWTTTPYVMEASVSETYDVLDRKSDRLTLRAKRYDGLVVDRTISLEPGTEGVTFTLVLSNPTDGPLTPNVKFHPEFDSHGTAAPEIWAREKGKWQPLASAQDRKLDAIGKYLPPQNCDMLGAYLPKAKVSYLCSFDPDKTGGLLWFFNVAYERQHVNLEVWPKDDPLAPGEAVSYTAIYSVTKKKLPLR
ncbi:MAG TPA: DUF4838 domain-containing protein [Candidatus Hydrogenedentes bacterium]|nr:DUF4838 domain-containing protein [Candidatus Hydrogenedentota bacterium]